MKLALRLLVISITVSVCPCFSQDIPASVSAARILDIQEVELENRKIIYNRIETPELKQESQKPAVAPVAAPAMSAQEEEELRIWEAKFQYSLCLSVTVYDGKVSELRWWEDGLENVVWSNINFMHFCPFWDLETTDAYYWLMVWGWETTTSEVLAMNAQAKTSEQLTHLPPVTLPSFEKAGPKWQAASRLSEGAKRAMNDFHEYYRKHGGQMAGAYARQEADAKAQEEWLKAHPPIPQDTIINYFPIRSEQKDKAQ